MAGGGESRAGPAERGTARDLEAQNLLSQSDRSDEETNKERREHIRHLQKEAFQLANYYFVFQGVIFTAFYNTPSQVKCRYHWVPFTLSLLAGGLNLCALSTIAYQYKKTLDDIDKNATRSARHYQATPSSGIATRDNQMPAMGSRNSNDSIAVKCEGNRRLVYVVGCMSLFTGFFVVTLVGCLKITCGDKSGSTVTPPPGAN
ncbi:hypothetical protein CDL12_13801 [Handroanthus impetiginosus]|uniref:Transmembrane protein n=1 Tax=Handroanthus impetiginosus TaxID=429701 RepID=A0A2G9H7R9_9LAMI|nr:hypothetical protein CDL12_13801 [Handroanthus impetiginosus]